MVFRIILISFLMTSLQNWLYFIYSKQTKRENLFIIRSVNPFFGFPINYESLDFFDFYRMIMKDNPKEFIFSNIPGLLLEIEMFNNFILPLSFEIHNLKLHNTYTVRKEFFNQIIFSTYSHKFRFEFIPSSLHFFWYPIDSEFRTFFLFQFGVSIDKFYWEETIDSNFPLEPFQKHQEKIWKQINPFASFAVGVELPFDIGRDSSKVLESFFFASKFNLALRRVDLFANLAIENPVIRKITVIPFSIVLVIGLRVNSSSLFLN